MEKKTDKSPVEQMREWLQNELNKTRDGDAKIFNQVLDCKYTFDKLFPEVQQLPIQDINVLASNYKSESTDSIDAAYHGYKAGYLQAIKDINTKI